MTHDDRDQIQELMFRYGEACDTRDYALLKRCFVEACVVRYSAFSGRLEGHDDLVAYLKPVLAELDLTQHIFTNFIVAVDGDAARFTCQLHAQHLKTGAPGGPLFTVGGKYKVELLRTADGWRMSELEFKPAWMSGNPALVAHEPLAAEA